VAVTTVDGPPDGTLELTAGPLAVGLFRYPHDPVLPGLPVATFADRLEAWLAYGSVPDLRVRSYRPTRRAVVHARWSPAGGATLERYVKCVPPGDHARVADWLTRLRPAVPAPVIAAADAGLGLLALEALPGRTIRDVLLRGTAAEVDRLPDGRAILDLLDRLPAPSPGHDRRRPGPIDRAGSHAALLAAVLPRSAVRVRTLVADLERQATGAGPEILVHGDLYDAQILVDRDGISGLLDLDDAGSGQRVDDLATFLAHLDALAEATPRRRRAMERYAARVRPAFELAAGPGPLYASTAAALVGLATGPFRVQQSDWPARTERRLALAERWSAQAAHPARVTRAALSA